MNPIAILYVLSLAAPLDSKSFPVRERAKNAIEKIEPADAWPAVVALARSRSVEVSESARRWSDKWPEMAYERHIASLIGSADKKILAAVYGPIEDKPWRAIQELEMAFKDDQVWRVWAIKTWRTEIKPMLDKKYKGAGNYFDDKAGVVSPLCFDNYNCHRGQLAGVIWHTRMIESQNGKNFYYPTAKDW